MIKSVAKISSFVFHPFFFVVVNLYLLICLKPQIFGVSTWQDKKILIFIVGVYSVLIPGLTLLMLYFLKIIQNFELNQRHERIFPLVIILIFYLWLWMNLKQDPSIPRQWNWYMLSAVVSTSLCLVINNWLKVSLHVTGITATILFWVCIKFMFIGDGIDYFKFFGGATQGISLDYFIMLIILLGGWIATARLIASDHHLDEIIIGTFVGLISIVIAFKITF